MLDAKTLTVGQLCARRYRLEEEWRPARWHPRLLFNHLMRQAVLDLSNAKPKEKVAADVSAQYLEFAARPGLDIQGSPYEIAQDFAAALRVLVEVLSRQVLLEIRPGRKLLLQNGVSWAVGSFEDQAGCLHHWKAVERVDPAQIAKEGHSWVWADSALSGVPMVMHFVETGTIRNGHLYGDLSRIFQHPEVVKWKFRHRDGGRLVGDWKVKWLQDMTVSTKDWVDMLERDNVQVVRHIPVKQPTPEQSHECMLEVGAEAARLAVATEGFDWRGIPKSRPSCDSPYVCPWQAVCYGPAGVTPETAGGYVRRELACVR